MGDLRALGSPKRTFAVAGGGGGGGGAYLPSIMRCKYGIIGVVVF